MISRKRLLIIDGIITMFLIAAPLIILGCIPYWPQGNGTAILFYIQFRKAMYEISDESCIDFNK